MNTDQNMNQKIKRAFAHATPDVLDSVLSDCKEQKGARIMTKKTNPSGSWLKPLIAVAAAILLLVGGAAGIQTYNTNHSVASTVLLDVNPSVEIQVNKNERVLNVIAHNEDGKKIIGDMDFEGSNLDVTVNALIGSMLTNGYLSEIANSILVSVDGRDAEKNAALQARLTEEINRLLQTDTFSGAVLSQTITPDTELQELADTNHISVGKAQLIQKILSANPLHTFDELAQLSINELNLLTKPETQPLENVESVGSASDKAYIGRDAAKAAAMEHLGVASTADIRCEIDLDYERGVMVYEVDFDYDGYEYDYHIDATTGEVVKVNKDRDDDYRGEDNGSTGDTNTDNSGNNTGNSGDTNIGNTSNNADAPSEPATQNPSPNTNITDEEAKTIALNHAGVTADNIRDYSCELDEERGIVVYEIEFESGNIDYSYDINAATGEIVEADKKFDD